MLRRMVALGLTLVLMVGLPATPVHADTTWRARLRGAVEFAEGREGTVSIAVVDTERMRRWHARRAVPMASVIKVMFMVAYLRQTSVRNRPMRRAERALLGPMIKRSDNDTATVLADRLGPRRMRRLARKAGMREFSYTRPWGLSTTSARDQARFMAELPRYIPRRHRPYAHTLLRKIVPSQRWGIGEIPTPGWRKLFKGGWGSGTGWVNHQVVQLKRRRDGTRVGLAVMVQDSPSHRYAARTLRGVFRRLLANLP